MRNSTLLVMVLLLLGTLTFSCQSLQSPPPARDLGTETESERDSRMQWWRWRRHRRGPAEGLHRRRRVLTDSGFGPLLGRSVPSGHDRDT